MVKHHENPPKSLECKEQPKDLPEKKLKTLKKKISNGRTYREWTGRLEHATTF